MGCTNSSSYSNDIKDDKNIIKYLNLIQTKPILASVSSYGYYLSAGEDKLITSLYYNYEIEPFYSDSLSSSTIQTFNGHTNMITALCFEDEHSFWSASRDNSIKYWSLTSSKELGTIPNAHRFTIEGIDSFYNNNLIVSGGRDHRVVAWDKETLKEKISYQAQHNVVTSLLCDQSNQNIIYQGSEDLCVKLWDIRSRHKENSLRGYVYFPLCIDQNTDKSLLYSNNTLSSSSNNNNNNNTSNNINNLLVTGSKGYNSVGCGVRLWDLRMTSSPIFDINGIHTQDVISVKFINNNNLILSISIDGSIGIWNLNGDKIFFYQTIYKQFSTCSILKEDNNYIYFILTCLDGNTHLYLLSNFNNNNNNIKLDEIAQTKSQYDEI